MSPYVVPGISWKKWFDKRDDILCKRIIQCVCYEFGISEKEIKMKDRTPEIKEPRQLCQYLMKKWTRVGHKNIAAIFNQNHATVVNSHQRISDFIETEFEWKMRVSNLENKILNGRLG